MLLQQCGALQSKGGGQRRHNIWSLALRDRAADMVPGPTYCTSLCADTRRPQRYTASVPADHMDGAQPQPKAAQPAGLRTRLAALAPGKLRSAAAADPGSDPRISQGSSAAGQPTTTSPGDGGDGVADAADELGAIPGVSQTGMGFGGGRFRWACGCVAEVSYQGVRSALPGCEAFQKRTSGQGTEHGPDARLQHASTYGSVCLP